MTDFLQELEDAAEQINQLARESGWNVCHEAKATIEQLQAEVERYRWRSVEDELPTDEFVMYAIFDGKSVFGVHFNKHGSSSGDWQDMWHTDESLPYPNVTHWAHLPEPPKEQSNE